MDITIKQEDRLRIQADHEKQNFIDICQVGYKAMAIDLHPLSQYIEIRKKKDRLRVFTFTKKSMKKECDFGWWEDADVVFSINERMEK